LVGLDYLHMKTVLVTGGAGYIGSHACKALAASGYVPITYDNLVYGHEPAVKWGPLERGDILDANRLVEVCNKYRPQAVMHFAAYAYLGESVSDPAKYYRNNVLGTLTLLAAMRECDIQNIVFSSSCATYGIPLKSPISEDTLQNPINPYGATKLMMERVLADYHAAYGLKSVALRYFNAAGADPDCEIGEDHDPETHLIPLVLDAAIGARPNITILGDDYDTPDGTCIRDFVHVSDIAKAHVLALEKLPQGNLRQAYNLGTGNGTSVRDVIETARAVTDRKINVATGSRRAGDPSILVADPRRANKDLDWQPAYPSIRQMVEHAWKWHMRKRDVFAQERKSAEKDRGARP
jgi:UDP-arabinose 4-epimerase